MSDLSHGQFNAELSAAKMQHLWRARQSRHGSWDLYFGDKLLAADLTENQARQITEVLQQRDENGDTKYDRAWQAAQRRAEVAQQRCERLEQDLKGELANGTTLFRQLVTAEQRCKRLLVAMKDAAFEIQRERLSSALNILEAAITAEQEGECEPPLLTHNTDNHKS
jgi:hypothetical protein